MQASEIIANATRAVRNGAPLALFLPLLAAADPYSMSGSASAAWNQQIGARLRAAVGVVEPAINFAPAGNILGRRIQAEIQREVRADLQLNSHNRLELSLSEGFASSEASVSSLGLLDLAQGTARHMLSPTWTARLNNGDELSLGGIFAYENFSHSALGFTDSRANFGAEQSSGSALSLGWLSRANGPLRAFARLQSQVRMDEYRTYRGIFADPGRFDLPARAQLGLRLSPSNTHQWGVSVERVGYANIRPFASQALPDRFQSLLGDSASPEFVWQDLTVYHVNYTYRPSDTEAWAFGWASRQQPEPTSRRLANALASEFTDTNLSLSYVRSVTDSARWRFGASYAPKSYFLGPSLLSYENSREGAQFEAEALFEVSF